jgi:hypothetical protein
MYGIMPPDIKLIYTEVLLGGNSVRVIESKGNTYLLEIGSVRTKTRYSGWTSKPAMTVMLYPDMEAECGSTKETHPWGLDQSKVTTSVKLWNKYNK